MQNLGERTNKIKTQQAKFIFVGSIEAGKSSLFTRLVDNTYKPQDNFVGVDFKMKYTKIDDDQVRCCYWDTAGQERFNSLSPKYYKDAHVILVCYDATNKQQIKNLQFWINTAQEKKDPKSEIVIVGCKRDKVTRKQQKQNQEILSSDKFQKYKQFTTSSKSGEGVNQLQEYIMSNIRPDEQIIEEGSMIEDMRTETKINAPPQVGSLNRQEEQEDKRCCCCCC